MTIFPYLEEGRKKFARYSLVYLGHLKHKYTQIFKSTKYS